MPTATVCEVLVPRKSYKVFYLDKGDHYIGRTILGPRGWYTSSAYRRPFYAKTRKVAMQLLRDAFLAQRKGT